MEIFLARFLTRDRYRSWMEGRSVPMILSAALTVLCSLSLSCLVEDPNQTVIDVVRTDWTIAV